MNFQNSAGSKAINQREHNEDASAKRVVAYYQDDNGEWVQSPVSQVGGIDYDYIAIDNSTPGEEVYEFKNGGAGGTIVQTVTITDEYIEYS